MEGSMLHNALECQACATVYVPTEIIMTKSKLLFMAIQFGIHATDTLVPLPVFS